MNCLTACRWKPRAGCWSQHLILYYFIVFQEARTHNRGWCSWINEPPVQIWWDIWHHWHENCSWHGTNMLGFTPQIWWVSKTWKIKIRRKLFLHEKWSVDQIELLFCDLLSLKLHDRVFKPRLSRQNGIQRGCCLLRSWRTAAISIGTLTFSWTIGRPRFAFRLLKHFIDFLTFGSFAFSFVLRTCAGTFLFTRSLSIFLWSGLPFKRLAILVFLGMTIWREMACATTSETRGIPFLLWLFTIALSCTFIWIFCFPLSFLTIFAFALSFRLVIRVKHSMHVGGRTAACNLCPSSLVGFVQQSGIFHLHIVMAWAMHDNIFPHTNRQGFDEDHHQITREQGQIGSWYIRGQHPSKLVVPALLELNLLDYLCHCLSFESSAKQRCAEMHQLSTSLDHVFLDNPSQSLIPVLISRAFYISKQNDFGSRSHLEGLAKHCHEPGASGNLVSWQIFLVNWQRRSRRKLHFCAKWLWNQR